MTKGISIVNNLAKFVRSMAITQIVGALDRVSVRKVIQP